ncbi:MAG: tetratricopeptide repeat protein, partial [Planctomycetota bacterium]
MRARVAVASAVLLLCLAGGAPGGEPDPVEAAWAACHKLVIEHKFKSDFDAARSALKRFLAAHPSSPRAADARKELEAVGAFADKQVQGLYDGARSLSGKLRYELALELYTEILTRAPGEEWVRKAREGIERNDKATEPLFRGLEKKCGQLFSDWKFSDAAELGASAAEQLAGTRWADPASRLLREARAVRDYFAALGRKVEETRENPRKTPFKVKDLTGWMVRGKIARIDETGFMCLVTGAGKEFAWKDRFGAGGSDPSGFLEIVDLYEPGPREQMALGILLHRLG